MYGGHVRHRTHVRKSITLACGLRLRLPNTYLRRIDVGTTRLEDPALVGRLFPVGSKRRETFERRGALVVGDVHPDVEHVAGALSPVPGGVGPLTIAMLLKNTVRAAQARLG